MRTILFLSSLLGLALCRPELHNQYRASSLGQIYPTQIPLQGHSSNQGQYQGNDHQQHTYTDNQQQSYNDNQQQSYNNNQQQSYNNNQQQSYNDNQQQSYNNNQQQSITNKQQAYRSGNAYNQQQSFTDKQQTYKAQNAFNQQSQYKGFVSQPKDVIPILAYSNDVAYDGSYNYNYETADGISRQETGVMTNPGTENEAQSVSGSYSYTAPDGTLITVTYTADANGFKAEGAHLPTPPPIPEAIAKSLEFIARTRAANPNAYQDEDGQYHPESNYQQSFQKQFQQNRYNA